MYKVGSDDVRDLGLVDAETICELRLVQKNAVNDAIKILDDCITVDVPQMVTASTKVVICGKFCGRDKYASGRRPYCASDELDDDRRCIKSCTYPSEDTHECDCSWVNKLRVIPAPGVSSCFGSSAMRV